MFTALLSTATGWFSNLKNIAIAILCILLIFLAGYAYFKGCQVEKRDGTIDLQKKSIAAKDAAISEYKANIELARQHQDRVVVIEKKGAVIQQRINTIKQSRELTDEEKIPAADITGMFNGMQHPGSNAGKSGAILSETSKAGTDKSKNGTGTADKL